MKVKLVQIKQDLAVRSDGFVLFKTEAYDFSSFYQKVHGYKPGEFYWVVDNDFDDKSWLVIKPHKLKRDEGFVAGGILKDHAEIKGFFRTLWGKIELGRNGLDTIDVRVNNLERRRESQRHQLEYRIQVKDSLLEESKRNYDKAIASAEEDARLGRLTR